MTKPPDALRGTGKLAAALRAFSLEGAVRSARAIDVGASTGGFSWTLLSRGAAHVTCIDVGHLQLHAELRADARVRLREGVDFRKLALAEEPGPFDFFSVDVSFASARSQLRPLAFRLRPGAQGVVLVKPQFELPKGRVREGRVTAPELRARAVARVREKAESLGFEWVEALDSPVPGGSGSVEILVHLRFRGRSAKLPRPGERRRPAAMDAGARGIGARVGPDLRWFVIAAPGLEGVAAREAASLPGVVSAEAVTGGVDLVGPLELGLRANLALRCATRVLLRLGELEAREFAVLRRRAGGLPWEAVIPNGVDVRVRASASRCRLRHTGAIEETISLAVADRLARAGGSRADGAGEALVLVRGVGDRWTLSIDASGELLHRRGWRGEAGPAPLRETLAAGLLALCEWDPATPLVDPLCGAGTIPVEAALLATGRAPGLGRAFACEAWPAFDADRCRSVRDEIAAATPLLPTPAIVGFDADASVVAAATRNAERAGVSERVRFAVCELGDLRAPRGHGRGLVLANPPYGRRLSGARGVGARVGPDKETYRRLGWILKERFARWQAGILVPRPELASALKLGAPEHEHSLLNGGVRVRLLRYRL